MELQWTSKAVSDWTRLYEFLVLVTRPAAMLQVPMSLCRSCTFPLSQSELPISATRG